ncbi:hypothetical protein B0J13DRAFT_248940 [Dactylonectria estremocensis]|uniref:poly(ADP-ribose) glycohydrolase n=1 Tax=Dactylonectria estremocensis TaxID=1079267 RepID=A0A9P9F3V2_9HYPO|nr:hypothetical protein B0J13DRAFT_248940 [Dactylonectria estremocensis]
MEPRPDTLILPNSPSCYVLDRFSDLPEDVIVEEDGAGRVPFWPLLQFLLQESVSGASHLIDRLQTIAANTEASHGDDYGSLKSFLAGDIFRAEEFFGSTWPNLHDIALDLPLYFPQGQLDLLEPGHPLRLSRGQVACLVVHQFLCSIVPQRQDDGYQDFGIWYASRQRHPVAVEMYLSSLFVYFESLPDARDLIKDHEAAPDDPGRYVTYALHERDEVFLDGVSLGAVHIDYLDNYDTESHRPEVQGPGGAVVVSANKIIGFGQSATQEEIFVGIAPEACPIVLIAPHLTDTSVITVCGARAILSTTGQRRDIHWSVQPRPSSPTGGFTAWTRAWRGGRLIFMDALEMDMVEASDQRLPDLLPENIDRELRKAVTGFTALPACDAVRTGLWGCGAFCGDAGVKLVVLWLAASVAGVRLDVMLGPEQHDIGRGFEVAVRACEGMAARDVRELLLSVPVGLRQLEILEWISINVSGGG